MHVLMPILGTAGDLFPFIGIGAAMARRGHRVTIVANDRFEPHARHFGLEFLSLGTEAEHRQSYENPDMWHWKHGLRVTTEDVVKPALEPVYEAICDRYVPGETLVACSGLTLGVMAAKEKTGVPTSQLVVPPMALRSCHDSPLIHPWFVTGLPAFLMRFQYWLTDLLVDRVFGVPVNAFRRRIGLQPLTRVWDSWMHSFDRVIGLFPEWFMAPQPDWPRDTHVTDFVLYDGYEITPPTADLIQFLDDGEPPIVFTAGSTMLDAREFFAESAKACELLGRRGLLMTPFPDQAPETLPANVRQAFAPFTWLLPRAAAIVHHGGVGTLARAIRAGLPQLVMPMAYDQPDNARRLVRLGLGKRIARSAYRASEAARQLRSLLASPEIAGACRAYARRFDDRPDPVDRTCDLLEELVGVRRAPVALQ